MTLHFTGVQQATHMTFRGRNPFSGRTVVEAATPARRGPGAF